MPPDKSENLPWLDVRAENGPRSAARKRLRLALETGDKHVWLRGPRSSGKSDLIEALRRDLAGSACTVLPSLNVRRAIEGKRHGDALGWTPGISEALRKIAPGPDVSPRIARDAADWLRQAITELGQRCAGRTVLPIEEIERATDLPEGDLLRAWLHAFASEPPAPDRPLYLCVVSALGPDDLARLFLPANAAVQWAPERWEEVAVSDLTQADAVEGLRHLIPDERHAEPALRAAYAWTGGHPKLTQRLCLRLEWPAKPPAWSDEEVEAMVDACARDPCFQGSAEPKEIAGTRADLRAAATFDAAARGSEAKPDLAGVVRALRAGDRLAEGQQVGLALLERAGLVARRDARPELRRGVVLAALFPPEVVHAECSGYGEAAGADPLQDDEEIEKAEQWLAKQGDAHARVVAAMRGRGAREKEKREADREAAAAREAAASRFRRVAIVVLTMLLCGFATSLYVAEDLEARRIAAQKTHDDAIEAASRLSTEGNKRLEGSLDALKADVDLTAAQVKERDESVDRARLALAQAKTLAVAAAGRAEAQKQVDEAQARLDAAKRDAEATQRKKDAADAALREATKALKDSQERNDRLAADMQALKDRSDGVSKALAAESQQRAACDRSLDGARAENTDLKKQKSDCLAERQKITEERDTLRANAAVVATPPAPAPQRQNGPQQR